MVVDIWHVTLMVNRDQTSLHQQADGFIHPYQGVSRLSSASCISSMLPIDGLVAYGNLLI